MKNQTFFKILGGSIGVIALIFLLTPKDEPEIVRRELLAKKSAPKIVTDSNNNNNEQDELENELELELDEEEVRAVWISTIWGLDFPHQLRNQNNPEGQKQEFIGYLDELQDIGFNTVMVQVRPSADAFYESDINPWSALLTGTQGKFPGYDPLAFMIDEVHKRGMKIHAWINPYRVTTKGKGIDTLVETHPARMNPDMLITHNDALYYNPEKEEVKSHIEESIKEIVENYDVDGVHIDDYFYPAWYPLPAGENGDGEVAQARRENVNDMVRRIHDVVKATKPDVKFGISPIGIWKDSTSDPTGSATTAGWNSYYAVYADTRAWIQNDWIDYVVPQLYWEIDHPTASYEVLVEWWADEVKGTDVDLYIGQGIYKGTVAEEITTQIALNELYPEIKGSVFFDLSNIIRKNTSNVRGQLEELFGTTPDEPLNLIVDTATIKPSVEPYLLNGVTLVPVQDLMGALDLDMVWSPDNDKQFDLIQGDQTATFELDKNIAFINDNLIEMPAPVELIDETVMIPITFLRDYMNTNIAWSPNTLTVNLSDAIKVVKAPSSTSTQ